MHNIIVMPNTTPYEIFSDCESAEQQWIMISKSTLKTCFIFLGSIYKSTYINPLLNPLGCAYMSSMYFHIGNNGSINL